MGRRGGEGGRRYIVCPEGASANFDHNSRQDFCHGILFTRRWSSVTGIANAERKSKSLQSLRCPLLRSTFAGSLAKTIDSLSHLSWQIGRRYSETRAGIRLFIVNAERPKRAGFRADGSHATLASAVYAGMSPSRIAYRDRWTLSFTPIFSMMRYL